jgi:hypothetical protein
MLVKSPGRWNELREISDKADHFRPQLVDGHRSPALVIVPPHTDALARLAGENEAGEDRPFGMSGCDGRDIRHAMASSNSVPSANIFCMSTQI